MFPNILKSCGIMGINRRNLDFIFEHNRRRHYPNADSKLKTKELAESVNVRVPQLYGVIEYHHQVKAFLETIKGKPSFVLKPNHGSGGGGILVIDKISPMGFRKASGEIVSKQEIRYHIHNLLSGMQSLGGQPDQVLVEEMVHFDPIFDDITYKGVPDIRIIVLEGKPLMAMLRLPTKASDGKANLHQGGIGVGIDLERGITTTAIQNNIYLTEHTETGGILTGRDIPYWPEIVEIALKMQRASQLGYVGVDIVLDKRHGPMVLELNVRPGISIQVANKKGLMDTV